MFDLDEDTYNLKTIYMYVLQTQCNCNYSNLLVLAHTHTPHTHTPHTHTHPTHTHIKSHSSLCQFHNHPAQFNILILVKEQYFLYSHMLISFLKSNLTIWDV